MWAQNITDEAANLCLMFLLVGVSVFVSFIVYMYIQEWRNRNR